MQARDNPGTRAGVKLRVDRFDLMTRVLGCESDRARAQMLDVDPRTVSRARAGIVGEEFIAQTLTTMQQHAGELAALGLTGSFEDLFEVRRKSA